MKKIFPLFLILTLSIQCVGQDSTEALEFLKQFTKRPKELPELRALFLMVHPMQKDSIFKNEKIVLDKIVILPFIDGFTFEYDAIPVYYSGEWHTGTVIHQNNSARAELIVYKRLWLGLFIVIVFLSIGPVLIDVYPFWKKSKKAENRNYLHLRYMMYHRSMVVPNFQILILPLVFYTVLYIVLHVSGIYFIISSILWVLITAIVSGILRRIITYFLIIKQHIAFA